MGRLLKRIELETDEVVATIIEIQDMLVAALRDKGGQLSLSKGLGAYDATTSAGWYDGYCLASNVP